MKKAIQRLVRADDGTVRIVYIDAETLKELPSLEGYQVINQSSNYWEPVKDVRDPNTPSETVKSEHLNTIDKSGDKSFARKEVQKTIDDAKSVTPTSNARQSIERSTSQPSETASKPESNDIGVTGQMGGGLGIGGRISSSVNAKTGDVTRQPGLDRPAYGDVSPVTKAEEIGDPRTAADISYAALSRPGVARNQRPNADFMSDIGEAVHDFFGPDYSVDVFSGKGFLAGHNANHPTGKAVDFNVIGPDGKVVNQSRMEDFGAYAASTGFKGIGIGKGYMTPGAMHLDKVHKNTMAWGAKGRRRNMDPVVRNAIESAGQTGAPVYGLGLPEYMPTTPTPRPTQDEATQISTVQMSEPKDTSFARKQIDNAVETPNNYEQSQSNPLGQFKDVTASAPGYTGIIGADAKEPTGFARRQGLDPVISEDITQATPARMASMGINPRSPSEISHMALTLAGELSPTSLAGIAKKDPTAMRELADMVTSIENRASSQTYSGITGTLTPSQYNSLSRSHMPTTRANYEKFGPTLEAAINGYYTGNLTPDNYDITSYHNNYVRPDWSAGMTNVAATGHHKFGEVNDGLYAPSQDFQRERARMGIAQRNDPDTFTGHPDYTGADWGGYGYSSRKDTPSERGSRFGGSGLGYSGYGGLDSPSERTGRDTSFGLGSKNTGSDKEKDRSLDKDKTDHRNGGRMTD